MNAVCVSFAFHAHILTDFICLLETLYYCQKAWGVHVSQRQIKDYGVGLIAPQTPQKLKWSQVSSK